MAGPKLWRSSPIWNKRVARRIEYRGVVLEEMDVDAVLARRPTVALIDELAHTNAPGSRHAKRYQDVEELLRAGINVIATLNIQHLESLYDLIERDMGVPVKERIPDYILGMADEIVNVDLPAEDLRERLTAGKIYPAGRVNQALENFFTADNLTRLREMTLGEIAHALDRRRREQSGETQRMGSDRVMVCLSSRGPSPDSLLRKAARIADRLYAPWYAVYIQTPSESIERIDAAAPASHRKYLGIGQPIWRRRVEVEGNSTWLRDDRGIRRGIRDHPHHHHGPHAAPLVPPLLPPVRSSTA